MSETIEDGDVLLCIQPLKIRKGRVYVFKSKSSASRFIIKRCVGVSGDTLVFKNMRIDDTSLQNSPKIELDYFRVYFSDFQDLLNFNKAVQNYKMIPDEDHLSCLVWINETDLNKIQHKLFSSLNYQRTTQIDSFIIKKSSKSFIPLSCYSDINIVDPGYFMLGDNNYVSTDSRRIWHNPKKGYSQPSNFKIMV